MPEDRSITKLGKSEFRSQAVIDKVPTELLLIVDDIKEMISEVYGLENVGQLYWEGSAPRGDFIKGKSDVDFTLICKNTIPENHVVNRDKLIKPIAAKWLKLGVTKIDFVAISESEISYKNRRKSAFILATDSVGVFGNNNYDFSFAVPSSRNNLAKLLVGDFARTIERAKAGNWPLWLAKMTIRIIYALAISKGASYERKITNYKQGIEEFTPELASDYEKLLEIRERNMKTNDDVEMIYSIASKTLLRLQQAKLIEI